MTSSPLCSLPLAAAAAFLAGELPPAIARWRGVERVAPRQPRRAVSPAASYAVDAVRALGADLADAAIFTFAGPPGSTLHLFDPARSDAGGPLVTPGFGRERSRRIHPYLLLLSLQNQVAATLSVELGLRGPCSSSTDAAAAFAELLPNLTRAVTRRPVLAVFASAADRAEQRSRARWETGAARIVEGAVALLFTAGGALGRIEPLGPGEAATPAGTARDDSAAAGASRPAGADAIWTWDRGESGPQAFAPVLEPALAILRLLGEDVPSARVAIHERHRASGFRWIGAR